MVDEKQLKAEREAQGKLIIHSLKAIFELANKRNQIEIESGRKLGVHQRPYRKFGEELNQTLRKIM